MNQKLIELNEDNFYHEVLNATLPVIVEFWAGWSESCKAITPILEAVATDRAGSVKFARVNVEEHEALTQLCGVESVPALLVFHSGGRQDQLVGRTTVQSDRD